MLTHTHTHTQAKHSFSRKLYFSHWLLAAIQEAGRTAAVNVCLFSSDLCVCVLNDIHNSGKGTRAFLGQNNKLLNAKPFIYVPRCWELKCKALKTFRFSRSPLQVFLYPMNEMSKLVLAAFIRHTFQGSPGPKAEIFGYLCSSKMSWAHRAAASSIWEQWLQQQYPPNWVHSTLPLELIMTKQHTGTNKHIQDKHIWKRVASYKEMLINTLFRVKTEQN